MEKLAKLKILPVNVTLDRFAKLATVIAPSELMMLASVVNGEKPLLDVEISVKAFFHPVVPLLLKMA